MSTKAKKKRPAKTAKRAKTTAKRTKGAALARAPMKLLDVERAKAILESCRDVDRILEIRDGAKLAAEYGRIRGASVESINRALEIVLYAQRRFGEFLIEAGPTRGGDRRSKSAGTTLKLDDLGVSRDESSRCKSLAKIPLAKLQAHIAAVKAKGEKLTTKGTINAISSGEGYDPDEWYTPAKYIDAAREVMGGIDLDPASNDHAQQTVEAAEYFTKDDDGLHRRWKGRVWLNPPFSQPLATDFAEKLLSEFKAGHVTEAVMVQNSGTDTPWFHRLAADGWICLVRGRINFLREDGESASNRYAQVFFYLGPKHERFVEVFGAFGLVGKLTTSIVEESEDAPAEAAE